jgi:NTE family protein
MVDELGQPDLVSGGQGEPAGNGTPAELALCLSGGGYRAMVFHLGALWRLNELGYLPKLSRISSVSGGSIAAGVLANRWPDLQFDDSGVATNFKETVGHDLHKVAGKTIDIWAVLTGIVWFRSVGNRVAHAYKRHLFGKKQLRDLPAHPRFIFNATNLQSGSLWRFSQPYMADYRVGQVKLPDIPLAVAVAASSAFPPFLSPVTLKLADGAVVGFDDAPQAELGRPPFTRKVVLSDGGVYDNLGLQTVLGKNRTLLVSDGGGQMKPVERPPGNWPGHTLRVLGVIDNQVRSLRTSHLVSDFQSGQRQGTYWGIRTDITAYKVTVPFSVDAAHVSELARTPTRLARMRKSRQRRLVNWGYTVSDAAMRAYIDRSLTPPSKLPYPDAGI